MHIKSIPRQSPSEGLALACLGMALCYNTPSPDGETERNEDKRREKKKKS
jgi:hypothetical protein